MLCTSSCVVCLRHASCEFALIVRWCVRRRFGLKQPQMGGMRNGRAQTMQQQQLAFGGGPDAFWDPISEPQAFHFTPGFPDSSHNHQQQQQQQQQHRQEP